MGGQGPEPDQSHSLQSYSSLAWTTAACREERVRGGKKYANFPLFLPVLPKGAQVTSHQFRLRAGRAEGLSGQAKGDFQDMVREGGRVGSGGTSHGPVGLSLSEVGSAGECEQRTAVLVQYLVRQE